MGGENQANPAGVSELMRRAFHNLRTGKPGPVLIELSGRLTDVDIAGEFDYAPSSRCAPGPIRPTCGRPCEIAAERVSARDPRRPGRALCRRNQGTGRARRAAPGAGSHHQHRQGCLPENIIRSRSARRLYPRPKGVFHFLARADCVIGIGTSLTRNIWAPQVPSGKRIIHATNDPADINKEFPTEAAILGDAKLVLEALIAEIGSRRRKDHNVATEVQAVKQEWLAEWMPELTSPEVPINQYRIVHELMMALPREDTIVTHDSGSPREQMVAFWECREPGGYLGWGKTTQLGHGLGLIMGAKLANPDKLCMNVMGDASIGMVGMDIETAVRNRIGILTIVFNNGVMAGEQNSMQAAVKRYNAADLGGNYSEVARALGAWSVRVSEPNLFRPALDQALEATRSRVPALIECVAKQNYRFSRY